MLFALPRFARDEVGDYSMLVGLYLRTICIQITFNPSLGTINYFQSFSQYDRVDSTRSSSVGRIEVVQYTATFQKKMYTKHRGASLQQANKKDAADITKGSYIMSTSKEGRVVKRHEPYAHRAIWNRGPEVGRQSVEYHMNHTLQDMGIQLKQMDWSLAPALTLKVENVAPSTAEKQEN